MTIEKYLNVKTKIPRSKYWYYSYIIADENDEGRKSKNDARLLLFLAQSSINTDIKQQNIVQVFLIIVFISWKATSTYSVSWGV